MAEGKKATSITLHPHGDGTYHTMSHGNEPDWPAMERGKEPGRVEHESFGHAVAHMAKHHASGEHMIIHGHEDGFTSHHVEDGKVTGPHEASNMREMKRNISDCMGGE